MEIDLTAVVAEQPDPLLFATVSGAHLYGLPSKAAGIDGGRVERDFEALHGVLEAARAASRLPEHADAFDALDEFVVRRRVR